MKIKTISYFLLFCSSAISYSCQHVASQNELVEAAIQYPDSIFEFLAIPRNGNLSAASKRALERNYAQSSEWFLNFKTHDLKGDLAYEEGVTRRDPSDIINVDGLYYVYYTKSTGITSGFGTGDAEKKVFPWDKSDIWFATSNDGWTWEEKGIAVPRGEKGSFDDRSVFTCQIMVHEGKFVLVYQMVQHPYMNRVKNNIGMAIANSPNGPFRKLDKPILSPSEDGEWLGTEDRRFKVKKQGSFDSHKVHDPALIFYNEKYYLYYKGERMGERQTLGGREIRWGVAISENLEGPYVKSEFNPITNSGHEVCIWPYKGGIAALLVTNGPESNTIQWAHDGVNYEIMAYLNWAPEAASLPKFVNHEKEPIESLHWGLTHEYHSWDWQHIKRFEGYRPFIP